MTDPRYIGKEKMLCSTLHFICKLYMTSQHRVCVPRGVYNVLNRFFLLCNMLCYKNVLHSMLYSIHYKGLVFFLYNAIYYIKMVI